MPLPGRWRASPATLTTAFAGCARSGVRTNESDAWKSTKAARLATAARPSTTSAATRVSDSPGRIDTDTLPAAARRPWHGRNGRAGREAQRHGLLDRQPSADARPGHGRARVPGRAASPARGAVERGAPGRAARGAAGPLPGGRAG